MINRCIVSVCYACLTVVGMLYSEMPESFQVIVYQSLDKRIYSSFLWGVFLWEHSVSWVVCASFIASDLHYCSKTGHLQNFERTQQIWPISITGLQRTYKVSPMFTLIFELQIFMKKTSASVNSTQTFTSCVKKPDARHYSTRNNNCH